VVDALKFWRGEPTARDEPTTRDLRYGSPACQLIRNGFVIFILLSRPLSLLLFEPFLCITDKSIGDPYFHALFDGGLGPNFRIMELRKMKAILQYYIASPRNILLEVFSAHFRQVPIGVLFHGHFDWPERI
jgi:hypothetical protein